jgi:hypothetical protein
MANEFVVFYTPASNNEVKYYNSHGSVIAEDTDTYYDSLVAAGHVKVVLTNVTLQGKLSKFGRNSRLVFTDSVLTDIVTHTNSFQPPVDNTPTVEAEIVTLKNRIAALEA